MNPLQYPIYKGMAGNNGALQFNLQKPHYYNAENPKLKDYEGKVDPDSQYAAFTYDETKKRSVLKEGWKTRDGAVFVEITSAKGKNVYDWENKIVFALSVGDMGKILYFLATGEAPGKEKEQLSLMHDPGAKSESAGAVKKFFNVWSPKGLAEGCFISISQSAGGETKKHTVPLTGDEVLVLRQLIQAAIPASLSW